MQSSQNKKVVWNTGSQSSDTTATDSTVLSAADLTGAASAPLPRVNDLLPNDQQKTSDLTNNIDPLELSAHAAAYSGGSTPSSVPQESISNLKNEIASVLSGASISTDSSQITESPNETLVDLDASDDAIVEAQKQTEQESDEIKMPTLPQDAESGEVSIDDLKSDIAASFGKESLESDTPLAKNTGVTQTYYSDLSTAMGANEPATMSELIQKSRFEAKEKKILSPTSRRNILYIAGAVILFLASIGVIGFLRSGEEQEIQFVAEERVPSLVYSNINTGINITGLEQAKTKQVIREVVEKEIPEDSINQIYYIEEAGGNAVRRVGIHDILSQTENTTADLLLENLEDDFMHGVYRTDRNYPFIVLKANSYDRALDGLKAWEPTMIDDLATYMDLPPEATDRSLLKPGFEDDLINNKNVRVARFLPREVDGRGIETVSSESDQEERDTDNVISRSLSLVNKWVSSVSDFAYAQTPAQQNTPTTPQVTGVSFNSLTADAGGRKVCYQTELTCRDASGGPVDASLGGQAGVACVSSFLDLTPYGPEYEGQDGYSCINILGSEEAVSQLSTTDPVCFDVQTGERIFEGGNPNTDLCFRSYGCHPYECRDGNGQIAPAGNPGVVCGESDDVVSIDYVGEKICRQYTGLLSLQNISSSRLCFDSRTGQYLANMTQADGSLDNVTCISPQSRSSELCIANNGVVFDANGPEASLYAGNVKFCFPRVEGAGGVVAPGQCSDQLTQLEIRQRMAQAAERISFIALVADLVGVSDANVAKLHQASDALFALSQMDVLAVETVRQVAYHLEQLEQILDEIDPDSRLPQTGPNGGLNVYGVLRTVIDAVKCALGIGDSLQWISLGRIPTGIPVELGETNIAVLEPLQEAFVLMDLMDPLSISGTLDLVTQSAIEQFQIANGLEVTGTLTEEMANLMNSLIENNAGLYGGDEFVINDYFTLSDSSGESFDESDVQILRLGSYNDSVQQMQLILYAQGYDISVLNGYFNQETCRAVQQFQEDQGLVISDDIDCVVEIDTLEALNDIIREENYLGAGMTLTDQGYLRGTGALAGVNGPGVIDYEVSSVDSEVRLEEGDIVLMYMFLDTETILIAREQVVIDEIVRRRALSDIFQN